MSKYQDDLELKEFVQGLINDHFHSRVSYKQPDTDQLKLGYINGIVVIISQAIENQTQNLEQSFQKQIDEINFKMESLREKITENLSQDNEKFDQNRFVALEKKLKTIDERMKYQSQSTDKIVSALLENQVLLKIQLKSILDNIKKNDENNISISTQGSCVNDELLGQFTIQTFEQAIEAKFQEFRQTLEKINNEQKQSLTSKFVNFWKIIDDQCEKIDSIKYEMDQLRKEQESQKNNKHK